MSPREVKFYGGVWAVKFGLISSFLSLYDIYTQRLVKLPDMMCLYKKQWYEKQGQSPG